MTRAFGSFAHDGENLAYTVDDASGSTGLLIVSGGNEIRSGAHAGMARLARLVAAKGFPVFRYDRRGVGESSDQNLGFLQSKGDLLAAAQQFRTLHPNLTKIAAFGNCDAATALGLFAGDAAIDQLILANPWVIEASTVPHDAPTPPSASAIRSRYWQRLKNPRSLIDLFTGKINIIKLLKGLKQASVKQDNTDLALRLRDGLIQSDIPTSILLAKRDTTALAFSAAWASTDFDGARSKPNITVQSIDSASHGFADDDSRKWFTGQILDLLQNA